MYRPIADAFRCVGPISFADVAFGLTALSKRHEKLKVADHLSGEPVEDAAMVARLLECLDMAHGAYKPSPAEACAMSKLKQHNVIEWEGQTGRLMPAHYLAVCPLEREVVWGVRGTQDLKDLLTDICSKSHPYEGGYAHWGMVHAARHLLSHRLDLVSKVLRKHQGYQLTLVGHSMGAGIAALMAHRLTSLPSLAGRLPQGTRVRSVGFATPATMSRGLADACQEHTTTVVLQHDCVPRFSLAHLRALREELHDVDWYSDLRQGMLEHEYLQGIAEVAAVVTPTKASEAMTELAATLVGEQYVKRMGETLAAAGGKGLQDLAGLQSTVRQWAAGLSGRLVALAPVDIKKVADEASEQLMASLQAVGRSLPAVVPISAAKLLPGDAGGGAMPGAPVLTDPQEDTTIPEHRPEEHLHPPGRLLYLRRYDDQDPPGPPPSPGGLPPCDSSPPSSGQPACASSSGRLDSQAAGGSSARGARNKHRTWGPEGDEGLVMEVVRSRDGSTAAVAAASTRSSGTKERSTGTQERKDSEGAVAVAMVPSSDGGAAGVAVAASPDAVLVAAGRRKEGGGGSLPSHTLVQAAPGVGFRRLVLRDSVLADHKCCSYRGALEDVMQRCRRDTGAGKLPVL